MKTFLVRDRITQEQNFLYAMFNDCHEIIGTQCILEDQNVKLENLKDD